MLLVTRGYHAHFPPPPTKLPAEIADEVVRALEGQDLLALTARTSTIFLAYA